MLRSVLLTKRNILSPYIQELWRQGVFLSFAASYVPFNKDLTVPVVIDSKIMKDFKLFINDFQLEYKLKGEQEYLNFYPRKDEKNSQGMNESISIRTIKKRSLKFHARFSAKKRIYRYVIFNQLSKPSIDKNRGWHISKKLDLRLMKLGAKKLLGTNDFSTFRASSCNARSPIKTMELIQIKSKKNKIEIKFTSQSFLQQQVRSMVGCLKYLSEKKWDLQKFEFIFKSKKRNLCAPPAPAHGLFLEKVIY